MKLAWLLVLAAAALRAQDGAVERGAQLYRTHCAVPYCHGPDGTAGRAPRLIGHSYSLNGIFKVISWGIPGTGMPEFTSRLKTSEIDDLVAYVMTLRGAASAPAPAAAPPPRPLTAEAKAGRALFFDATRLGGCGRCHELDGWGAAVGPDLSSVTALREVEPRRVVTVRPAGGEAPFAAVVAERTSTRVRVYDLTAALPVLRTFAADQIVIESGSSWRHEDAVRGYTAGELDTIAKYLRGR